MPSASVSGEVQAPQRQGGRHEPHAGTHAYGRAGRRGYYRESGIFAHEEPVRDVLDRLDPEWIHGMHGGTLGRETIPHFTRALREEPFADQGKLLGREVLTEAAGP
jgi:hypothetical protein